MKRICLKKSIKNLIFIFIIILSVFTVFPERVYADEADYEEYIEKEMEAAGIYDIQMDENIDSLGELDISEMTGEIASGRITKIFGGILEKLKDLAFGELKEQGALMQKLLAIAV
ncbi:MAG: hypothetical protein IJC39_05905 [Firmicutes bacterium]|nr:hypothetical protein [Bacillota bacterium]